jgi:hypothetical protein
MRSRLTLFVCGASAGALIAVPLAGSSAQKLGFTASLTAPTHTPVAGKPWRYSIYARGLPGGDPISAIAKRYVTLNGRKIDTLGWNRFRGVFRQTYVWPRVDRGKALVFHADVTGPGGVWKKTYAIRVQ